MTDKISGFIFLFILKRILKFLNHEGYSAWKKSMRDNLKMINFWTWITVKTTPSIVEASAKKLANDVFIDRVITALNKIQIKILKQYNEKHDKICTALRIACENNAYTEIENMKNAVDAWNHFEKFFKLKNADFLNDIFRQLNNLILTKCESSADYVIQFRGIINKLKFFSTKFTINENYLIYRFFTNLSSEQSNYFERYVQNHDLFNEDETVKHSFNEAMQHFQNSIINPKTAFGSAVMFMATIRSSKNSIIKKFNKNVVQPTTNETAIIIKTIKYCGHCQASYHSKHECYKKHSHLFSAHKQKQKKRKNKNKNDKSSGDNDVDKSAYFVFMIISFSAKITIKNMINLWIWDCGNNQHICHDLSVFTQIIRKNLALIQKIGGVLTPRDINTISLSCVNGQKRRREFPLYNVLYVPERSLNLIFQRQLQQKDCSMKIVSTKIEISSHGIMARRQQNNLYLLNLFDVSQFALAFAAVNSEILKMWHVRFGHLEKQNVIKLAGMSQNMNLVKSPSKNACDFCAVVQMFVKSHKTPMKSDKHSLNLIYNDVQGPFKEAPNGARYMVTFLNDFEKRFHVTLLRHKNEIFQIFLNYKKQNEYEDRRIKRLKSDNGGEYASAEFKEFRLENDIAWKFIVSKNSKQNDKFERLSKTLQKFVNTMRVDVELNEK